MLRLAILGRPNVGKSSLFNRLCKRSRAIVNQEEGTTRDILTAVITWHELTFEIVDTGGIDKGSVDKYQTNIKNLAIDIASKSDVLILVVDGTTGILNQDKLLAEKLLALKKPIILAINKIDTDERQWEIFSFYKLGISEMINISAAHGKNISDLILKAFSLLAPMKQLIHEQTREISHLNNISGIKVALIGSPNVGKSTLINTVLKEERCLTDDIPGTTRDNIDVVVNYKNESFIFIDTAGMKKQKSLNTSIEWIAASRAEKAISRSNICLLLIDAVKGFANVDRKLLSLLNKHGKPFVLVLNKWDLIENVRMEHYMKDIQQIFPFLNHIPIICMSALTQRNVYKIFPLISSLYKKATTRLTTHSINKLFIAAMHEHPPSVINGKRLRVYYATQGNLNPPEFILFVNQQSLLDKRYDQYLKNKVRKEFNYFGVPFVFKLKEKQKLKK